MVSQPQNYPPGTTMPPSGTVVDDRGIREPNVVPVTNYAGYATMPTAAIFPNFWGSVIGGTLVAITFSVLSYALMFGVGVGITATGNAPPNLTWGSAIWAVITTWLAYLLGAFVAGRIGRVPGYGWLRGMTLWGLSLPLAIIILAIAAAGASTVTAAAAGAAPIAHGSLFNFGAFNIASGEAWTIFTALLVGCLFAVIGGMLGSGGEMVVTKAS